MTNDFLKKFIHKKVSPWDKGALIYHKEWYVRLLRQRENKFGTTAVKKGGGFLSQSIIVR